MFPRCFSLAFLLILSVSGSSYAAIRTTARDGDWASTGTWDGGTVPVSGDSVVIGHVVTLSTAATLAATPGISPAPDTPAISINSDGVLALTQTAKLAVTGDIVLQSGGHFSAIGLSGQRAVIEGNRVSTFKSLAPGGQVIALRYVTLSNLTVDLVEESTVTIENTHFVAAPLKAALRLSSKLTLKDSTFSQTDGPASATITTYAKPIEGLITSNVFDKSLYLHESTAGLSITGNLMMNGYNVDFAPTSAGNWFEFSGNLIRSTSPHELTLSGDSLGNYWLKDEPLGAPALENPHFVQILGDATLDGDIFEFNGSDDSGDAVLLNANNDDPNPAPRALSIFRSIVLPNAAGKSSGTLFTALGDSASSIIAEHNTYFTGTQGAAISETYPGFTGMIVSFRSNIAWDTEPNGYKLYDSGNNQDVVDLVLADKANYNTGFNVRSGSNGKGYNNLEFSGGAAPGVYDVDVDPQFVDPNRDIASFGASLGGAGTVAGTLALLAQMNADAPPSGYTIAALIDYIRKGFKPNNSAIERAAHDGSTVGAIPVPGITPTPPTATPTASATQTSTATPTPTATWTETATPLVEPTSTSVPTATNTPTQPNPTVAAQVIGLQIKVKKHSIYLRWTNVGAKSYQIILKKGKRVVAKHSTKRLGLTLKNVKAGTYTVECSAKKTLQPLLVERKRVKVKK